MSFTVGSRVVADIRVQGVTLRHVVGAYELIFGLYVNVIAPEEKGLSRRVSIIGAEVHVGPEGKGLSSLGFARPNVPFQIDTKTGPISMTPTLSLPLVSGQVAAIEELRDGSDLRFELSVIGTGADQNGDQQVQDIWRYSVSKSDWIKTLKAAGARNILLLEVPVPLEAKSEKWMAVTRSLQRAEEQYRNGDYPACIASCRTVIQELGYLKFDKVEWAPTLLGRLVNDRRDMMKEEREGALWATLHHYTHQAHHGESEGGIADYSRAEAQFVLTLTASFLNRAQIN